MKHKHDLQNIYNKLKKFSPVRITNITHKNTLLVMLEKEMRQKQEQRKQAAFWHRYAVPAFAACIIFVVFYLAVILTGLFRQNDLATLYPLSDEELWQDKEYFVKNVRGHPLQTGKMYNTGVSDKNLIIFNNGALVKVFSDTEFMLTKITKTETWLLSTIYLNQGVLECDLENLSLPSCFAVATDSARIEVSSTHFKVEVQMDKTLRVTVTHGQVKINHLHNSLDIFNESELAAEDKRSLELLLQKSYLTLSQGRTYISPINLIQENREVVYNLTKAFLNSANQADRKVFLKEIEDQINLFNNKLKESVFRLDSVKGPLAVLPEEERIMQTDSLKDTQQKQMPSAGTGYIFSTLERDDPWSDLWKYSGPKDFFSLSNEFAYSGERALKIEIPEALSEIFAWHITFTDKLPFNKKLTLRMRIKTQNLIGQGIALAIRVDKTLLPLDQMLIYSTTRDTTSITGTRDWQEFTLAVPEKTPPTAKSVSIYLLYLPRTTGAAYFDDIRLEFN